MKSVDMCKICRDPRKVRGYDMNCRKCQHLDFRPNSLLSLARMSTKEVKK